MGKVCTTLCPTLAFLAKKSKWYLAHKKARPLTKTMMSRTFDLQSKRSHLTSGASHSDQRLRNLNLNCFRCQFGMFWPSRLDTPLRVQGLSIGSAEEFHDRPSATCKSRQTEQKSAKWVFKTLLDILGIAHPTRLPETPNGNLQRLVAAPFRSTPDSWLSGLMSTAASLPRSMWVP